MFITILIKCLITSKLIINAVLIPIKIEKSKTGFSLENSNNVNPNIVGRLKRNENFTACSILIFFSNAVEIVIPLLEIPGMTDKP